MSALFPVHGWAVSEGSLIPTKPGEESSFPGTSAPHPVVANRKSVSKKRKRDGLAPHSHSRVTGDEMQRLWNAEFGHGQSTPTNKKKRRKSSSLGFPPSAGAISEAHDESRNLDSRSRDLVTKNWKNSMKAGGETEKNPKQLSGRPPPPGIQSGSMQQRVETHGRGVLSANPAQKMANPQRLSDSKLSNGKALQAMEKLRDPQHESSPKLTPLQAKMRGKLTSARFRHLNELLYTSPSSVSFDLFTSSPDLFKEYHEGFSQQVNDSWPENPVDSYVREILARAPIGFKMGNKGSATDVLALPRRKTQSCTLADLGCGDAPLARALSSKSKSLKLKFHNFDLHAPNTLVTMADIANLPLRDGEVDVAIFCLSLMGTNWLNFIEEAWRILRGDGKGELWIAEVKSRFGRATQQVVNNSGNRTKKTPRRRQENRKSPSDDEAELFVEDETSVPRDETDISGFVNVVQRRGFALRANSVNKHNKMFVSTIFTKSDVPTTGKHEGLKWDGREYKRAALARSGRKKFIDKDHDGHLDVSSEAEAKVLKPCVYKKR